MKKILIFIMFVLVSIGSRAQMVMPYTVNSTGGTAVVGGDVYDWSFAEMVMISTSTSPNLIVTAGLLQPIDPNVSLPEHTGEGLTLNVFPNPAADMLNLETAFSDPGKLMAQLYDVSGKQVKIVAWDLEPGNNLKFISLDDCAPGMYLLRIYFSSGNSVGQFLRTFKIQKIQ